MRCALSLVRCTLSPIPAFPREAGEGDAATCGYRVGILQHLPPPCMGEDRGGGQTTSSARCPPSQPSPAKRGKETLPHAGTEWAFCSIFLPHAWGRTEVGDKRLPIKIFTLRHSAVGNHKYPKYFRLQQGGKRIYPDELTDVSDSLG